jgi:hypothetical protein
MQGALAIATALSCLAAPAEARARMRPLSSPDAFEVPGHRRDGARLRKVLREHFAALAPHLVEVVRDCPRPRGLVRIRRGDSPHLFPSPNHAGPHLVRREVRDRLIFAAAFARAKAGVRIAIGIGRRSLRAQATLWNWRLVERFAALLRRRRSGKAPLSPGDVAHLARRARPDGEVANPRRFGCGSPHLTGDAVDVILVDARGRPLVDFKRRFFYGTKKAYEKRFLTSNAPDARWARFLEEVMYSAGFVRYCREAWHFETGRGPLHRFWRAAGRPGRCFGAGRGGTWDPRRDPDDAAVGDMLAGLPET